MKKLLKTISLLIIVTTIFLSYLIYQEQDKNLQVIFFDVGQGDAALIKTPAGQKILIDGGPDNTVINKIGRYFSFADKTIDLVILTHAHSDHLVGLVEVLKRYEVKKVLYNGPAHTTPEFFQFLEIIKANKIPLEIPLAGQEYNFADGVKLKIIFPLADLTDEKLKDLNEGSLVCQLIYQKTNYLFMGDLPAEQEKLIINQQNNLISQVIKIGHHGSKYSTGLDLLKAVQPQLAVISVGKDNDFNHPAPVTINRLRNFGVEILRTDEQGEIIIKSNGSHLIY